MMRKRMLIAAGALAALGITGQADAQTSGIPLSVEVRGGAAFPMGDFGDEDQADADTGVGFGATAGLNLTPLFGVYGGYSRFEFGAGAGAFDDDIPSGTEVDYIDSGFNAGFQITPASQTFGNLSPWLRAGAVYRKLEIDFNDDAINDICDETDECETDSALGFEFGAGLDFPLGQVISVTPGVRYVTFSPDPTDNGEGELNVRYFVADVGLRFRF